MKLSKKDRRSILRCVEDAKYQVDQLYTNGFLSQAHLTRLDTVVVLLNLISTRLEDAKHGRRRHQ